MKIYWGRAFLHEKILCGVIGAVGYSEVFPSEHVGNVGSFLTYVGESGPSVSRCLWNLCWSMDSRFMGSDWE